MLEVLGRGYVIDHCVASYTRRQKEKIYRVYITDALRAIVNNTAQFAGNGLAINDRYIDIIEPKPKEELTTEKVVGKIRKKLGGG